MAYCTQVDVEFRAPAEQIPRPARAVSSVSASTDILTLDGHGTQTNDPVTVRAESGGTLPSPLAAGTTYYAIRLTDSTLQLSATVGGSAIDLSTAGSNTLLIRQIPWDRAIAWADTIVDEALGSAAPIVSGATPPAIAVIVSAELAAEYLRQWAGVRSAALTERITWAQGQLDRWRKGVPVRGTDAPQGVNQAIRASVTSVDSRGWVRTEGSIP